MQQPGAVAQYAREDGNQQKKRGRREGGDIPHQQSCPYKQSPAFFRIREPLLSGASMHVPGHMATCILSTEASLQTSGSIQNGLLPMSLYEEGLQQTLC